MVNSNSPTDVKLFKAAFSNHPKRMLQHVTSGASINARWVSDDDSNGCTPLMIASVAGHFDTVSMALYLGADPSLTNSEGLTARQLAEKKGHSSIQSLLAAFDNDSKEENPLKSSHHAIYSFFDFAVQSSLKSYPQLLKKANSTLRFQDDAKSTLMHAAVHCLHYLMVKHLHSVGVSLNLRDGIGRTPLHLNSHVPLIHWGYRDYSSKITDYLISHGANLEARDNNGDTPLAVGIKNHQGTFVQKLKAKGASIGNVNNDGQTILHLTALYDYEDRVVNWWRQSGASFDVQDHKGRTALHVAVENNNRFMVEILKTAGASLEATDHMQRTVMHLVIENSCYDTITVLKKYCVSLNARDAHGLMPIHIAVKKQSVESLQYLVDIGANIDEPIVSTDEFNGYTPLLLASHIGDVYLVCACLYNGANINHRSALGHSAADIARARGHTRVDEDKCVLNDEWSEVDDSLFDSTSEDGLLYRPVSFDLVSLLEVLDCSVTKDYSDECYREAIYNMFFLATSNKLTDYNHFSADNFRKNKTIQHQTTLNNVQATIRLLQDAGAPLNLRKENGRTLLHVAVEQSCEPLLYALCAAGVSIDERIISEDSFNHRSALFLSLHSQTLGLACILINFGAGSKLSKAIVAERCKSFYVNHMPVLLLNLVKNFIRIDDNGELQPTSDRLTNSLKRHDSRTLLKEVFDSMIKYRLTELLKKLLEVKLPLTLCDDQHRCLLDVVVQMDSYEALEALVAAGVSIDTTWTPSRTLVTGTLLHHAIGGGFANAAEAAIKLGANVHAITQGGKSVGELVMSCESNDVRERLQRMLKTVDGATIEIRPQVPSDVIRAIVPEDTPFWLAANNDAPMLAAELAGSLDPNMKTENGMTLLHWACAGDAPECVQLLLEAGADKDAVANGHDLVLYFFNNFNGGYMDYEDYEREVYALTPSTYARYNSPDSRKMLGDDEYDSDSDSDLDSVGSNYSFVGLF